MSEFIKPLISVIIPIYNDALFLRRCLDSILTQTYETLEIILVDDGSLDGSGDICKEYVSADKRVKAIHKLNEGTVSARKCGLGHAQGQLVSFIDGDDWIEIDAYEKLVSFFFQERCPDMVSSGMFFEPLESGQCDIWLDGAMEGRYCRQEIENKILPALIYNPVTDRNSLLTSVCTKLVTKLVAQRAMDYMDDTLTLGEDGAYVYFLVSCCTSLAVLHRPLYHYEQHTGSQNYKFGMDGFLKLSQLRRVMTEGMGKLGWGRSNQIRSQINYYVWGYLCKIISHNFQMDPDCCMYLFPFAKCEKGCTVLIYGAGKVGKSYVRHLERSKYVKKVIWADRNYRELQNEGLEVISVDEALQKDYDNIVIAINDEKVANTIMEKLILYGVEKEKMIWEKPIMVNPFV